MTQTTQPCTWAVLSNAGMDLTIKEPEDNRKLMLSLLDSLNNLNEKLTRLDSLIKRKKMEQNINRDNKDD